jgi:hypothetical protein
MHRGNPKSMVQGSGKEKNGVDRKIMALSFALTFYTKVKKKKCSSI